MDGNGRWAKKRSLPRRILLILPIFEYVEHEIPPSPKKVALLMINVINSINKKTPCKHERVFSSEDVQKLTDEYVSKIDSVTKDKEKEIMEV
jgi:hypothetical protein